MNPAFFYIQGKEYHFTVANRIYIILFLAFIIVIQHVYGFLYSIISTFEFSHAVEEVWFISKTMYVSSFRFLINTIVITAFDGFQGTEILDVRHKCWIRIQAS